MTIVVTVKVTDGIVLAADSAATFYGVGPAPKIYNNANKIFNLVRGKPIGALVYGAGGIGSESVETLSKDFRSQTKYNPEYEVDNSKYTVHGIAEMVRGFLFDSTYKSAYPNGLENFYMGYRVCGYSSGATLPEVWEFSIYGDKCTDLNEVQSKEDFGVRWAGENEALDRLLLGATSHLRQVLQNRGMTEDEAQEAYLEIVRETGALV